MVFPEKSDKYLAALLALLALPLLFLMLKDVLSFAVDDSFIFFRYAENLATGKGFVFNAGEPPGEGFTSWIWLLLLAFFRFIGFNLLPAAKGLGILFHLSGGIMIYLTVKLVLRGKPGAGAVSLISAFVFLLDYRLVGHSVSGMETSLYIFAITLLVYLTTRALSAPAAEMRWWFILSLTTLAVFLVRPEGITAGGISLLALALRQRHNLLKLKPWLYGFLGLVLPVGLFILMKILVFGYPLPHSFYHKFIVVDAEYGESLRQMLQFIKSFWWLIFLAFIAVLYTFRHVRIGSAVVSIYSLYYGILFIAMTGLYLLFYPAMNYLHRFYIPYFPLLLLMLAPALNFLVEKIYRLSSTGIRLISILLMGVILAAALNVELGASRDRIMGWSKLVDPSISRAGLGKRMSRLPQGVTVANTEMGVIPFYSGLTCIDMAGLTDPHTAHYGVSMPYLEKRKTDLILFPRDTARMTREKWNNYSQSYGDVFLSAMFEENFVKIGWRAGYYIYLNRTSPYYETVVRWGEQNLFPEPPKIKLKSKPSIK